MFNCLTSCTLYTHKNKNYKKPNESQKQHPQQKSTNEKDNHTIHGMFSNYSVSLVDNQCFNSLRRCCVMLLHQPQFKYLSNYLVSAITSTFCEKAHSIDQHTCNPLYAYYLKKMHNFRKRQILCH